MEQRTRVPICQIFWTMPQEGRHPARQTILKVVKRLRETGCVTSRPRVRRPRNVGRKVQPEDVLAYALAHPRSSTKMMSENCGLSKGLVLMTGSLDEYFTRESYWDNGYGASSECNNRMC
ncbi:hypothetical protein AVEN_79745-1 [Araneus ventricosus]|uniref:DUF4817 domain-containing protein n=1 Tax=Araneus ventricosus TaxID=182803 RepID=A0A4Y2Q1N2_ARAVE|nr:hypothetical protein AVEN_79745-1 [Araneus ventricosus]